MYLWPKLASSTGLVMAALVGAGGVTQSYGPVLVSPLENGQQIYMFGITGEGRIVENSWCDQRASRKGGHLSIMCSEEYHAIFGSTVTRLLMEFEIRQLASAFRMSSLALPISPSAATVIRGFRTMDVI